MSDPVYHAMVNAMRNYMHEMTLTPSEMRSAVMLACIQFESQRVAPSVTALSRVPAEYLERDNG